MGIIVCLGTGETKDKGDMGSVHVRFTNNFTNKYQSGKCRRKYSVAEGGVFSSLGTSEPSRVSTPDTGT